MEQASVGLSGGFSISLTFIIFPIVLTLSSGPGGPKPARLHWSLSSWSPHSWHRD